MKKQTNREARNSINFKELYGGLGEGTRRWWLAPGELEANLDVITQMSECEESINVTSGIIYGGSPLPSNSWRVTKPSTF